MKWVGGTMNLESAKEVLILDQEIEKCLQQARAAEEEILQLTRRLRKEAEEKAYLNFYIEEDMSSLFSSFEAESAVMIGTEEGGELEMTENEIVIHRSPSSHFGMNLTKLRRSGQPSSFSISK